MPAETVIYAKDYRQPAFFIDKTFLRFELEEGATRVHSRLLIRRNPQLQSSSLVLDGQDLELQCVKIDGKPVDAAHYRIDAEHLSIDIPGDKQNFEFQCTTVIYPEKNTSLEGLYRSRGMYCTQCEAEGFRKITYYLDRPDVMSEFEVILVADRYSFPVMLSNGNCISDKIDGNKREVIWHDPFKKPCYLFALVAGDLVSLEDVFVTQSGRQVTLKIYVEPKDLDKCDHAMQSLQKAMRWDEEVYGREYDLDIFMIVAVDDFNMGAMENKGLNIFNTSCVLANPATTTDDGYERVEAVVAHEYFHNWSGNRVTCRDWFQLSLKEGFTVFRDAEFSADMNSRDVKRIEDVILLRSVQFVEDAGPMAHPVRPDSYMEISNFYTVTVYEKGAEVVRMMANMLSRDVFRKATNLYFERHDGQAVTCEDFVLCMEEVSGIDLQQFRRWYSQAGTPLLKITDNYDADQQRYTLNVEQVLPVTPHEGDKQPFHIPLRLSLFGEAGTLALYPEHVSLDGCSNNSEIVLDVVSQFNQFHFFNVDEKPVPSLLRGFSAPVKLEYPYTNEQLAHLIAMDNDGFARWDACQSLATKIVRAIVDGDPFEATLALFIASLRRFLQQDSIDNAMKALMLVLPGDAYIAEFYHQADPVRIYNARQDVRKAIAVALREDLLLFYRQLSGDVAGVSVAARSARSLRNMALSYLMLLDDAEIINLCVRQFETSSTMTDQLAALKALVNSVSATNEAEQALAQFYQRWESESLVVNMWLQVQAASDKHNALESVMQLLRHDAFDYKNPNKVRSLIGVFCNQNLLNFHSIGGEGYRFLAQQVMYIDKINPQIAARLLVPLTRWQRIEPVRSDLMRCALQSIAAMDLSSDVYEVVSKSLAI